MAQLKVFFNPARYDYGAFRALNKRLEAVDLSSLRLRKDSQMTAYIIKGTQSVLLYDGKTTGVILGTNASVRKGHAKIEKIVGGQVTVVA